MKDKTTTPREARDSGGHTTRETERERIKGKKQDWVSLVKDGSQGGNGLLHLIHIPSGELEHRGD